MAGRRAPHEGGWTSEPYLPGPAQGGEPLAITAPTPPGFDVHPAFSPDGRRLAYASCAGGINPPCQVYVVDLGVDFRPRTPARPQLTRKAPYPICGLAWTRDGRSLVYSTLYALDRYLWCVGAEGDSPPERSSRPTTTSVRVSPPTAGGSPSSPDSSGEVHEIWLAEADGSSPVQLTRGPGCGDRPDGHDIYRIPDAGGQAERLTHNGGLWARESPDGKTLFYTQQDDTSPLFSLPLAGGPERRVIDCVLSRSLAAGPDGMYYLGCAPGQREAPLYRLDPATGQSRLLGEVETGRGDRHLAVSPDGKTILFTRRVAEGADLMLIDNFR